MTHPAIELWKKGERYQALALMRRAARADEKAQDFLMEHIDIALEMLDFMSADPKLDETLDQLDPKDQDAPPLP